MARVYLLIPPIFSDAIKHKVEGSYPKRQLLFFIFFPNKNNEFLLVYKKTCFRDSDKNVVMGCESSDT